MIGDSRTFRTQDPTRRVPCRAHLAVFDVPGSEHARKMYAAAHLGSWRPVIRWIRPGQELNRQLDDLHGKVLGIALPLAPAKRCASSWVEAVVDSIRNVSGSGTPVFVACGNYTPNPFATAGYSCGPVGSSALFRLGDAQKGSSAACVLAATHHAATSLCLPRPRFAPSLSGVHYG